MSPADLAERTVREFYPKPAVGQTWVDFDGDVVTITDIQPGTMYPVGFAWRDGDASGQLGREVLAMPDFEPTTQTWLEHVRVVAEQADTERDYALSLLAEERKLLDAARADVSALRERLREAERERDALRGAVVSGAEWKEKVRASVLDQPYPWSEWPKLAAIFQHRPRVNVYWGELARFVAHAASSAGLAFLASPPPVLDEEAAPNKETP